MATTDATEDLWKPSPPSNYGKDEMVTLLVGAKEQELYVYGSYLLRSDFFKATLKKEWVEGQTRTVKLPEEGPETVAYYIDFLYSKGLPTDSTKNDSQKAAAFGVLAQLYALGERLLDTAFRNTIMKEMVRFTTVYSGGQPRMYCPSATTVSTIYDSTPAESSARRLMMDLLMFRGDENWIDQCDLPPDFVQDLAKALLSQVKKAKLPCRFEKAAVENYLV